MQNAWYESCETQNHDKRAQILLEEKNGMVSSGLYLMFAFVNNVSCYIYIFWQDLTVICTIFGGGQFEKICTNFVQILEVICILQGAISVGIFMKD